MPPVFQRSAQPLADGKHDHHSILLSSVLETMAECDRRESRNLYSLQHTQLKCHPVHDDCGQVSLVIGDASANPCIPQLSTDELEASLSSSLKDPESNQLIWHCPGAGDDRRFLHSDKQYMGQARRTDRPEQGIEDRALLWGVVNALGSSPGAFSTPSSLSSTCSFPREVHIENSSPPPSPPLFMPDAHPSPLHPKRLVFSKAGEILDHGHFLGAQYLLEGLNPLELVRSFSSSARQLGRSLFPEIPSPPLPKSPIKIRPLMSTPASALCLGSHVNGESWTEEVQFECDRIQGLDEGSCWKSSRGLIRCKSSLDLHAMEDGLVSSSLKEQCQHVCTRCTSTAGGASRRTQSTGGKVVMAEEGFTRRTLKVALVALILFSLATVSFLFCYILA